VIAIKPVDQGPVARCVVHVPKKFAPFRKGPIEKKSGERDRSHFNKGSTTWNNKSDPAGCVRGQMPSFIEDLDKEKPSVLHHAPIIKRK